MAADSADSADSADGKIDARIRELDDWRGEMLARVEGPSTSVTLRDLVRAAVTHNTAKATR